MAPIIPAAAIASAHVAANMIRSNMQSSGSSYNELSYKDRHLLAVQNALLQCQDLSNVPDVEGYISVDTDAKRRIDKSCMNCKYSKYFPLHKIDESEYESKTICLKMLIEFTSLECIVDDKHFCSLYEYDEQKEKSCCCNCGE
jgi:hypothetical protein